MTALAIHPSPACPVLLFIITVLVILGCLCSTSLFLAWTQVPTTPKNLLYLTVLYILVPSKVDFLFFIWLCLYYATVWLPKHTNKKKSSHYYFFFTMFCILDFTVRFVFLVGQCGMSVCICICIYVDTPLALRPFSSPFPSLKPGWDFIYCLV